MRPQTCPAALATLLIQEVGPRPDAIGGDGERCPARVPANSQLGAFGSPGQRELSPVRVFVFKGGGRPAQWSGCGPHRSGPSTNLEEARCPAPLQPRPTSSSCDSA